MKAQSPKNKQKNIPEQVPSCKTVSKESKYFHFSGPQFFLLSNEECNIETFPNSQRGLENYKNKMRAMQVLNTWDFLIAILKLF